MPSKEDLRFSNYKCTTTPIDTKNSVKPDVLVAKATMNDSNTLDKDTTSLWKFLESLNNSGCELETVPDVVPKSKPTDMDAFFYIVVVLVFYASSIVLLLIKYSRKDDEEKFLNHQFSEFVKRDKFQSTTYQNRIALVRTKEILEMLNKERSVPSIKVQSCDDLHEKGKTVASVAIDCQSITETDETNIVDDCSTTLDEKAVEKNEDYNCDSGINNGTESEEIKKQNEAHDRGVQSMDTLQMNKGCSKVTFIVKEQES